MIAQHGAETDGVMAGLRDTIIPSMASSGPKDVPVLFLSATEESLGRH